MKQEKFITEKYLDRKLAETTKVIVTAVDGVLTKRLKGVNGEFIEVRNDIGRLSKKIDAAKDELKADINNVQKLIDGYVKAQEEFKQEFIIMKEEIKQMKEIIKEKLGIEIKAFG